MIRWLKQNIQSSACIRYNTDYNVVYNCCFTRTNMVRRNALHRNTSSNRPKGITHPRGRNSKSIMSRKYLKGDTHTPKTVASERKISQKKQKKTCLSTAFHRRTQMTVTAAQMATGTINNRMFAIFRFVWVTEIFEDDKREELIG